MNQQKKILYLSAIALFSFSVAVETAHAQDRDRVVRSTASRPTNQPPAAKPDTTTSSISSRPTTRPPLLQNIDVGRAPAAEQKLVSRTGSSRAIGAAGIVASRSIFSSAVTSSMQKAIFTKLGIPYLYGSSGPNRYDCSGFVWAVFGEAGMNFTRQSARSLWAASEPVTGDERFRFGTLVFMNGLGHMGIVADENGFYHASSSKGITYSPFKGYWENRIVGFRRLATVNSARPVTPVTTK